MSAKEVRAANKRYADQQRRIRRERAYRARITAGRRNQLARAIAESA